jgi:hypothetical protein
MLNLFNYPSAYRSGRKGSVIGDRECFFIIQAYNSTAAEIEALREEAACCSLRLTRLSAADWQKTEQLTIRGARHLPMETSNYILLGERKLPLEGLKKVKGLVQEKRLTFIAGYQEKTWFDNTRLIESGKLKSDSRIQLLSLSPAALPIVSPLVVVPLYLQKLFHCLSSLAVNRSR